jgi:hypothetical protein
MAGSVSSTRRDPLLSLERENTQVAVGLRKEVLDAYEKASRLWLARVKSELELWSELTAKLTAIQSAPEVAGAHAKSVARRMQATVRDGQRLFESCQAMTDRMAGPLNGRRGKQGM